MVSLNTQVLLYICKGIRLGKVGGISLCVTCLLIVWGEKTCRRATVMQNFPQSRCHTWISRNTTIGTLIYSQYEAAVKDDENENVTLLLSTLMVSTLPSQPCFFATLQHLWKTAFFKHTALQKVWHWRSWHMFHCTSTQVSEDKRTKWTRRRIPAAQPHENQFCTCWTNKPSSYFVPSIFFLDVPNPWPSG